MKYEPGETMDINHWIENKPIDTNPNLIYVKEPNSFSTTKQVEYLKQSDLQQVRDWKNKVVEIRDRHKGSELYVMWDLEAKRVIEFLNKFSE
jgi:hypothetical protein